MTFRAPRRGSTLRVIALVLAVSAAPPLRAQSLEEARELLGAGQYAEAAEVYRAAAAILMEDDPAAAGAALNNACVVLMNTGDLEGALGDCREALRIRRGVGDEFRLARTLNNLGLVLQYLAEYEAGEQHFTEALDLNRKLGDAQGQTINLANLGVLATQAGWYTRAIEFYQGAMDLALEHPGTDWSPEQVRLAKINQAVVLEELGAHREALDLYRQVLSDGTELDPRRQAGLSVNVGVVYRNLGDPVSALEFFEQAGETYERLGDSGALSNVFLNIGLVRHLNLEQPAAAESAYREALRLAEASGERSEEIHDLWYLGRFLFDEDRADEAEAVFRRSLEASERSGSAEGHWASLEGLARIAASRGRLPEALDRLRDAMHEIEETRGSLENGAVRGGFFGQKRPVYAAAIEVLYALSLQAPDAGYETEAFAVVQRAKARVLLDALGDDVAGGDPLEASDVITLVGDGALLEYFVGESKVFAWVVNRSGVTMHALGSPEPILRAVAEVHGSLSDGSTPPRTTLEELSRAVFSSLGSRATDAERLHIAPDSRLHYLPFEILRLPGSGDRSLIETVDVSYLPSGSALGWLDRRPLGKGPAVVGLGAPVLGRETSGELDPATLLVSRFDLADLSAASGELDRIGNWLDGPSEIRTGPEATEEALRELAAKGPRVVHLASHAVVDERHRRGAAVLLSPGKRSDGLLYPDEIASLDYPVSLTVLAACRTALGSEDDGRALASLTGSFLAAGSSSVLATLWDVGDQTTSAFMEQFYYQLGQGLPPATALRRAKRSFMDDPEWQAPHLWAAYVLVGETGPVASGPGAGRWGLVVAVSLALALVSSFWLFLRRRSSI